MPIYYYYYYKIIILLLLLFLSSVIFATFISSEKLGATNSDSLQTQSVTTTTTTLKTTIGTLSSSESDKERKRVLRRKRKRLQKLRQQIRQLRTELFEATVDELSNGQKQEDNSTSDNSPVTEPTLMEREDKKEQKRSRMDSANNGRERKMNRRKRRWRQRMARNMKKVLDRMDRLETAFAADLYNKSNGNKMKALPERNGTVHLKWKNNIKKKQYRKKHRQKSAQDKNERKSTNKGKKRKRKLNKKKQRNVDPFLLKLLTSQSALTSKQERLHVSINKSLNGAERAACDRHGHCKPGLCCHLNATLFYSGTCLAHRLSHGHLCTDSCQCDSRLHCYKRANQAKISHYSRSVQTEMMEEKGESGWCKTASTEDILRGVYINNPEAVFSHVFPALF